MINVCAAQAALLLLLLQLLLLLLLLLQFGSLADKHIRYVLHKRLCS
jgi:hypothetical protein